MIRNIAHEESIIKNSIEKKIIGMIILLKASNLKFH